MSLNSRMVADAYAHRKQVGVRQLYNQLPQTAWGSQFQFKLGTRCRIESQRQTEGFGRAMTHGWAAQPECERSAAMVRITWDEYVAVCLCLQLTSHTQPTSTLLSKVWGVYFYKEMSPFVHWSRHYVRLCPLYIVYAYYEYTTDIVIV